MKERKRRDVELWEEPDHVRPPCCYLFPQSSNPILQHRFGVCLCQPLPLQLLYLSRIIHHETTSVLYGQNKISVTCREPVMLNHLEPLEHISLQAWANIQSLHIEITAILDVEHCAPSYEVLDRHDSTGSANLTRWTAICAFIAARITPFQLSLSVLCAVKDLETAIDVTESMSQLPPLKKCSIHFGIHPDKQQLRSLAKESVLRFTKVNDEHSDKTRSCWNTLPSEVRLQILMQTDLVGSRKPLKERMMDDKIVEIENGVLVPRTGMCCGQCTEELTPCFCPARNAAFSDTCICSPVPTAIFRVSKLFNHEATKVFFSMNIFSFGGNLHATTQFLARLPDSSVQNMRIIELHLDFQQLYHGLSVPGSPISRDWQRLIALLRDRLSLSKVWLSILTIDPDTENDFADMNAEGDHDYKWLHTTAFQLLKPLKELKGLRKFHVSLCWSTEFEAVAEKAVMGPEYDSMAEGKPRFQFYPALNTILRMPMLESLAKPDM